MTRARALKRSREAERRLAKIVGGKRNPSTGILNTPDVETETHAFELKSWQSLPDWLHEAMEQAHRCAAHVSKQPVLVLEARRPGGQNVRYYVQEESEWLKDRKEAESSTTRTPPDQGDRSNRQSLFLA